MDLGRIMEERLKQASNALFPMYFTEFPITTESKFSTIVFASRFISTICDLNGRKVKT